MTPAAFDLFTVGHSNHSIDRFLALLAAAGVTAVADVRSRPFSRRHPWFTGSRLGERLAAQSIRYLTIGEALGGRPRDPALFRAGVVDYAAMAALPEFRTGIDRVIAEAKTARLCLMCAERDPLDCHRFLLIAPALAARNLRIGHILGDGSVVSHEEMEAKLLELAGDGDLFTRDGSTLARAHAHRARAIAWRRRP